MEVEKAACHCYLSTQAEYMAFSLACNEAIWLRAPMQEFHYSAGAANVEVTICGDNKPAMALTTNIMGGWNM